jgi:large repetitive protein
MLAARSSVSRLVVVLAGAIASGGAGCGGSPEDDEVLAASDGALSTGSIRVTASTTGTQLDVDGYDVSLDGRAVAHVVPNGSVTINTVTGGHQVGIGSVAANCRVAGANPATVSVSLRTTTTVGFTVQCTATQQPPSAPASANATPTGSTRVELTWADTSSNESGFRVERSTDGGTSYASLAVTGASATVYVDADAAVYIDGIPHSGYLLCYRVVAFNALGDSAASNVDCTTPQPAPTQLTAAKVSATVADLWWTDRSSNEDGYEIQRAPADTGPFTTIATIPANYTSPGTVTYRDAAVPVGAAWYRVRAMKDGGFSDPSNTAPATEPSAPAAPTWVNATPWYGSMIGVDWADGSTNEDGFRVERSADGGTTWTAVVTAGPNSGGRLDVGPLPSEVQFCYRVIAFNRSGDSAPSPTDCTVIPASPEPVVATAVDDQTILLTWQDNSSVEEGYAVYRADLVFNSEFGVIALLAPGTTSFVDTGLVGGNQFDYYVSALKDGSGTNSGIVSATTPPAPDPLGAPRTATSVHR